MKNLQKMGGIAALGHATALVVGMVLSFTFKAQRQVGVLERVAHA
ncbi:hypothetical protein [Candidatus Amarolinea dominans]